MYDGSTALILAARLAVEGMVEELITCHADVNSVDELGKHLQSNTFFSLFFKLVFIPGVCCLFKVNLPCTGLQLSTMWMPLWPC